MMTTTEKKAELKPQRKPLYKELYNAARWCVDPSYKNDGDAVRAKRDQVCTELFGKYYDELTDSEICDAIAYLRVQSGFQEEVQTKSFANKEQLKNLRFYSLSCALVFANMERCNVYDKELGEDYSGEYLRKYLISKFDESRGWIPPNIFRHLHVEWINPKCHQFLIEGGFKKFTKDPHQFHYEYLKPQEAQCLIKRFSAIYQNIEMKRRTLTQEDLSKN